MNLNEDLVSAILETARQKRKPDRTWTLVRFRDFPGSYSHQEIVYHLNYCKNRGLLHLRPSLSASARVSLTPKGLKYLENQER